MRGALHKQTDWCSAQRAGMNEHTKSVVYRLLVTPVITGITFQPCQQPAPFTAAMSSPGHQSAWNKIHPEQLKQATAWYLNMSLNMWTFLQKLSFQLSKE